MHIFISYSKKDTRLLAQRLWAALNNPDNKVTAWMDNELQPGGSWAKQIEKQISDCDYVIVLLSPDVNRERLPGESQDYSFVLNEIGYARDKGKTIIPVVVETTEVPIEIRNIQHIQIDRLPGMDDDAYHQALIKEIIQRFAAIENWPGFPSTPPPQPAIDPSTTEIPEGFINRERWLREFQSCLGQALSSELPDRQIFEFTGSPGIGKTELFKAFGKLCRKAKVEHVYIDLSTFIEEPRHITVIEALLEKITPTDEQIEKNAYESLRRYLDTYYQRFASLDMIDDDYQFELAEEAAQQYFEDPIFETLEYWLRLMLESHKVLVLIFDGVRDEDSHELKYMLKKLADRVQRSQLPLIIISGGRKPMDGIGQTGFTKFSYVPHRGRPHPQPASIQLEPLRKEYAFAHWKLITTNNIFDSDQETYYTITQGHPRSNILLARRLENEPDKSLNDLRSAIAEDLANGMLDDALVGHPDEAKLRTIVQLVAPLRTFDRITAVGILEHNWPAESFQDRQIQLNNYLVSLIKLGILSRDEFVYHLDPLLRHFVIEDLRYNKRETYVEICETAQQLSAQSFQELLKNLAVHHPSAPAPMLSGLCREILNLVYYEAEVERWQKQRSDPAAFINNLTSQFRDYLLEWEAVSYPDIYRETTITIEELLRQDEDILKLSGRRGRDALLRVLGQLRKPA